MALSQEEQLILSSLNSQEKLHSQSFNYQSVFLSSVIPDPTNARFFPCVFIDDEHAKQFVNRKLSKKDLMNIYYGEDRVLIGKSCIINCLKYGSHEWKKANQTIESIIELGNNISVSELIQVPTIYPLEDGKYQVLTGHRRFFALVYANGLGSSSQFKIYDNKPLLTKVKQFQENASREDLPQYGKLQAFLSAMMEIDSFNNARLKIGMKKLTVKETASNLGISMGAFDNYNVLTRYPCVLEAFQSGLSLSFVKVKKVVLSVEAEYRSKHDKSVLNITDKKQINQEIKQLLSGKKTPTKAKKAFKFKAIQSANTLKTLLTSDVTTLDIGIDWDNIDWQDHDAVNNAMATVIEYLETRATSQAT